MRRISEDSRNNNLSLIDAGFLSREVGTQLSVSHAMVGRVRTSAKPRVQKSWGGRPAKLTTADKCRLVCMITLGKANNTVQLTRQLRDITSLECSSQAVCRALKGPV